MALPWAGHKGCCQVMGLMSKWREEPPLLYLVSLGDLCCQHLALFAVPGVGVFCGGKVRDGEEFLGPGGGCERPVCGSQVSSGSSRSLPCTRVGGTGLGGTECHTMQPRGICTLGDWGAKKGFRRSVTWLPYALEQFLKCSARRGRGRTGAGQGGGGRKHGNQLGDVQRDNQAWI